MTSKEHGERFLRWLEEYTDYGQWDEMVKLEVKKQLLEMEFAIRREEMADYQAMTKKLFGT